MSFTVTKKGKSLSDFKVSMINKSKEFMLRRMEAICVEAVVYAIDNHEFDNDTNNLEDSYGGGVYQNGVLIFEFYPTPIATEAKRDVKGGEAVREFIKAQNPSGEYSMVIAAGMWYAGYVELNSYDVLTQTEQEMPDIIRGVFNNMNKL